MPDVYESSDLVKAIQISPNFLNRLVERSLHGIKPSLRADVGTGGRRWFSREDLFGVALVWWLFQAGLRAGAGKTRKSVIQDVLNQILAKPRGDATANDAAEHLVETGTKMLVVIRELGPATKVVQAVKLLKNELDAAELLSSTRYDVVLAIPIGNLFEQLRASI